MIGGYFLFKDRANKIAILGLAIALVGAFCVGSGDIGLSRTAFMGDLLSLLGTLAVAVNMLIAKRILERVPSYLYSLIVFAITFVCFAVYNLSIGASFTNYPRIEWLLFLLLAIVPTVFGHLIFNWLLQYVKTTTISMSVLAEPVGASILGMIIFHEMISEFQLIGGVFIMIGLLFYLKSEQQTQIRISDSKLSS
jgi:drug/metabolite transporter (DMT)-like permease